MLKGFREFLSRGNIVDLAVAVVIGTAFTGLVTKFTDSIITPLIDRIGAGKDASYGILQIDIGGGQTIDLNILLSAFINFVLVAAVVYFLVVLPYSKIRGKGEAESADDTAGAPAHRDPRRPRRQGHRTESARGRLHAERIAADSTTPRVRHHGRDAGLDRSPGVDLAWGGGEPSSCSRVRRRW